MMRLYLLSKVWRQLLYLLDYMITDKQGEPDQPLIKRQLLELLSHHPTQSIFITEGYICRNAYLEIDNLKRGGSDYTASLIGAALDAKEVQIWTDIDGPTIMTRIVEHT